MKNALLTVGLPVRNNEHTVAKTIRSILRQSWQDFDLLVCDDGSTDSTRDVVRSFRDPRITLVTNSTPAGVAVRLNDIAGLARTPLLARMDGDDIMHPQRLESQVRFIKERSEIDVVGTDAYIIDEADRVAGLRTCPPVSTDPWIVAQRSTFIHPSIMGRRDWFRANPYSTQQHAEDHELWIRTCNKSCFAILRERLLFYRIPYNRKLNRLLGPYLYTARMQLTAGKRYAGLRSTVAVLTKTTGIIGIVLLMEYLQWPRLRHSKYLMRLLDADILSELEQAQRVLDFVALAPTACEQ
jgi:glycosyltransferase involved in cell wall biosynthesis